MVEYKARTAFGSRLFVSVLFTLLTVSFVGETGVMIWEYGIGLALPMATFDSHLFLFFPTFGLVGLFAFWRAAGCIVDAYWRYTPGGKVILPVALVALAGVAGMLAMKFNDAPNRLWWEISKPVLLADQGEPAGCQPPNCERAPVVEAYSAVRRAARTDEGLSGLEADCGQDNMSAFRPPQDEGDKFCFVTGAPTSVPACCAAKLRFKAAVLDMERTSPSLTHVVHTYLMPLKAFFLLMLLGIGLTLARKRRTLEAHYPRAMEQVERTIPIGGLAMMLWPLMNQAYAQSFDMLYGAGGSGAFRVTAPLYTLAFGGWGMILLFYYFRRYPKATEGAAKAIGGLLAGVSILKFDVILAYVSRFLGAGANVVSLAVVLVITAFLIYETMFHVEDPDEEAAEENLGPFEKAPIEGAEDEEYEPVLADIIADIGEGMGN